MFTIRIWVRVQLMIMCFKVKVSIKRLLDLLSHRTAALLSCVMYFCTIGILLMLICLSLLERHDLLVILNIVLPTFNVDLAVQAAWVLFCSCTFISREELPALHTSMWSLVLPIRRQIFQDLEICQSLTAVVLSHSSVVASNGLCIRALLWKALHKCGVRRAACHKEPRKSDRERPGAGRNDTEQ